MLNLISPKEMEGKSACSNCIIDMTVAEFGACKNCGLKKIAHNSQAIANPMRGILHQLLVVERKSIVPAKEPEKKPDPPKEQRKSAAPAKFSAQKEESCFFLLRKIFFSQRWAKKGGLQ